MTKGYQPNPPLTDPTDTLVRVSSLISQRDLDGAAAAMRREYPFLLVSNAGRRYSPVESMSIFLRDRFRDRYSGKRLINPAALRLMSAMLPNEFPFHQNWKQTECHVGYWELFPTVDHVIPVARGGCDEPDNWVTTSMLSNSAKSNWTLEELGWKLRDIPGDPESWDGLTEWAIRFVDSDPKLTALPAEVGSHRGYIMTWVTASKSAFLQMRKR
jgi:5-methylcytosine-specific restriction endonuclease McrA